MDSCAVFSSEYTEPADILQIPQQSFVDEYGELTKVEFRPRIFRINHPAGYRDVVCPVH